MVRGGEKNVDAACQALVQIVEGSSVKDVVAQLKLEFPTAASRRGGRGGKENPPGTGRRSRNRRGGKAHRKDKDKAPSGGEKEKKEGEGSSKRRGGAGGARVVGVVASGARFSRWRLILSRAWLVSAHRGPLISGVRWHMSRATRPPPALSTPF